MGKMSKNIQKNVEKKNKVITTDAKKKKVTVKKDVPKKKPIKKTPIAPRKSIEPIQLNIKVEKKYLKVFTKKQLIKTIICIMILALVFGGYAVFNNYNFIKLKRKGYSITDISIIIQNLKDDQITTLLKNNYITDIEQYIICNDFNAAKLNRYYSYKKDHSDLSYKDVVTQVNIGLDQEVYKNPIRATIDGNQTLINKYLNLSENYIPSDLEDVNKDYTTGSELRLVKEAKEAFEKMCTDAFNEKITLLGYSGYRSYNYQTYTYNTYVKRYDEAYANSISAKAGFSEHQLGLAIDITNKDLEKNKFETTKEYEWLINNSYKYGFILRYQNGKEKIQQYSFEPWHYRYVGVTVATDMHDNYPDLVYDEYYYRVLKQN